MIDLKNEIKARAFNLGFIRVGFTNSKPLIEGEAVLRLRLEEGKVTPFEEQDINVRIDPKAVWPPCETVVVLAYPLPLSSNPLPEEGILARSAVGEDYHHIIRAKLDLLIKEIMEIYSFKNSPHYQVDTGPLNERGFAVRAGVGWIGKNQQLIIPRYGSFVALALILLDVKLKIDEPKANQCGSCSQCIKACPAQILGEDSFDPRLCLSYITQKKDELTLENSTLLQGRVFGCDTCQEACPHNRNRMMEEEKHPHELHRGVDLKEILNLTKGEFNKKYRFTAAGWRGKGTLQRNAFVAIKSCKNPDEFDVDEWLNSHLQKKSIPEAIKPYINLPSKKQ